MIVSAWNQGLGAFDYFEGAHEQQQLNAEKPGHLVSRTLGATVDQAAWPMPAGMRKIGSGPDAIGRIAVAKGAALGAVDLDQPLRVGVLVLAGYLVWKYALKRRR